MTDTPPTLVFDKLMALGASPTAKTNSRALARIAMLVDLAADLDREDGIARALEWCDGLAVAKMTKQQATLLDYYRANAWAYRKRVRQRDPEAAWQWEQPEQLQEILCLRRAAQSPGFEKLAALRRCQILTNLANQLSSLGRSVEAVATWTQALRINPAFGMALGNRGAGLQRYGACLYDGGHYGTFLTLAHKDLTASLTPKARHSARQHPDASSYFVDRKREIETKIDLERARKVIRLDDYNIGASNLERRYRRWTLRERLFLNPLNDLGAHSIAARDMLSLPTYTTDIGQYPSLISFFDQMKQEFVSGRWLLFEGLHAENVHFSDRYVTLYNSPDYPSYSLAVENVKAAFRTAYAILDKIAFFLNEYAELGVPLNQVYFKTIWYENCDRNRGVRSLFLKSKNWPLRGLYWLAKDLFDPALQDAMLPDAQALYTIRNHLEHSYLKVHEILLPKSKSKVFPDAFTDKLAYSIERRDLNAKTLQLYRMARAGMIYLALTMHHEEQRRDRARPKGRVMPMSLGLWKDTWKR